VNVSNVSHAFAVANANDTARMHSAANGSIPILGENNAIGNVTLGVLRGGGGNTTISGGTAPTAGGNYTSASVSISNDTVWFDLTRVTLPSTGLFALSYSVTAHAGVSNIAAPGGGNAAIIVSRLVDGGNTLIPGTVSVCVDIDTANKTAMGTAGATVYHSVSGNTTVKVQVMRTNAFGGTPITWSYAAAYAGNTTTGGGGIGYLKLT
jgi:hypothetical protein